MNTIIYIIIFMMGTVFGSFYTLAVYRIPRKIDITHTHSFCPNCNHKLGFFELIPILSYIFLGGKCKKCGKKIRIRYLLLEVLSGLTFVLIAFSMKFDIYSVDIKTLINFAFLSLYLVAIFLIAGIDKESKIIEKSVLYYAIGIFTMYIIYLCIMDKTSIYRYAMYLIALVILLTFDNFTLRNKAKENYGLSILILLVIMLVFTGEKVTICTCILTPIIIFLIAVVQRLKNVLNKNKKENIDIIQNLHLGFYLGTSNIICFIIVMFINNWILI
ncbi:MAG: prepilin peptidase [Clostridia bacterium]|nr:prepilin peptidase [Clostridia bacterium]